MMETIRVNMNPNPLDVQTIHASQNDNEAREWGFALHNNGDAIDSSEITDQMVFKSYKGGTEQLLPENTSTPTTSPFLGDIRYPQGLLTDQEFTYRQSPTEEDGLAKVTDIKGNTLVWNQLAQIKASASQNGITFTNNNDGTYTVSGTASANAYFVLADNLVANHKYLISVGGSTNVNIVQIGFTTTATNTAKVITAGSTNAIGLQVVTDTTVDSEKVTPQVFDLTKMFGEGNEPSTVEEFTSLFPLPYYDYNQGTLLSFNGNGIKTVGKNLLDESTLQNGYYSPTDGSFVSSANYRYFELYLLKGTYTISTSDTFYYLRWWDGENHNISDNRTSYTFTLAENATVKFCMRKTDSSAFTEPFTMMVENSASASSYEPFTENTTSLPISTYFPTGMKSAGSIYDELTPTKAVTRIGVVDLGTLGWTAGYNGFVALLTNVATASNDAPANMICTKYPVNAYTTQTQKSIARIVGTNYVRVLDSDYESASALKSAMSGVYLCYELGTYEETSFTTASLVTENAEIPLSNEDGILIGKCTEQLCENPGFFDAKIKLTDSDGECYSNKIQLHIERSPQ